MFKALPKTLAAAGLAVTVALGGIAASATQARADNDNLRTFLGAAAGLIVLGTILENQQNRTHYAPVPYAPAPVTRYVAPGLVPVPQLVAPSVCHDFFRGPSLNLSGFGAHCMHSHVPHHASLPDRCLDRVFTYQGWRYVYDAQCLYSHGWTRS
jgi:hypothetical protein